MASLKDRTILATGRSERIDQIRLKSQGAVAQAPVAGSEFRGRARLNNAAMIRIERIIADQDQPRQEFDPEALAQLAASLKQRGQLQPIRVRWSPPADHYIVVVGERRWRAAQLAGLTEIACIVTDAAATPDDLYEDQIIENCLRVDLNDREQAKAFRNLMDRRGYTQAQVAAQLNLSQGHVQKMLAILTLPEPIQEQVAAGKIGVSNAYNLSRIPDPVEQERLAGAIVAGRVTRDEVAQAAKVNAPGDVSPATAKPGPVPRPKPVTIDLGEETVTVRWISGTAEIEAVLERALANVRAQRNSGN